MPHPGRPRVEFACALIALALAACTPHHHTIKPYDSDADAARALEARALAACKAARGDAHVPARAFTTDGCSLWVDGPWRVCCVAHDIAYWCGGSYEQRQEADHRLRECVAGLGHPNAGAWMHAAVRFGGGSLWPFPWRWGYGWDWPGE